MKIYTKTGDRGTTSLVGGTRVPKCCTRVDAYGDADELISWLGLIIAATPDEFENEKAFILEIQKELMAVSAHFACDGKVAKLKDLDACAVELLEKEIDRMTAGIPEQTAFILPGAPRFAAAAHVARTVCRRCERHALKMLTEIRKRRTNKFKHNPDTSEISATGESYEEYNIENILVGIKYLNRLSDYLFTLGRYFTNKSGGQDINWIP